MSIRPIVLVALLVLAITAGACSSPPADSATSDALATPEPTQEPTSGGTPSDEPVGSSDPSTNPAAIDDPLLLTELVDVRSGDAFTLAELVEDGPVIVETMAIWCTNCKEQMREVTAAHDLANFHSVSIDVESTEIAEDLVAYAGREGFDWPFVLADAQLANQLRDRFGTQVLFPPGMPKFLVRIDGSVELLPLGELLSADEIAAIIDG